MTCVAHVAVRHLDSHDSRVPSIPNQDADVEVRIARAELTSLNEGARLALAEVVQMYARDVLLEAGRFDENFRGGSGDPEITAAFVRDADRWMRRGYVHKKRSGSSIWWHGVSLAGSFVGGVAIVNLSHVWGLLLFVLAVVGGVGGGMLSLRGQE